MRCSRWSGSPAGMISIPRISMADWDALCCLLHILLAVSAMSCAFSRAIIVLASKTLRQSTGVVYWIAVPCRLPESGQV
jgi:hypothetical protein